MSRVAVDLADLLSIVDAPQAVLDLRRYFEPDRAPQRTPTYSGSRFEVFAGGGDLPEIANRITSQDLVAITLLSVDVPGDVTLQLLEGDLCPALGARLAKIPTDVSMWDAAASDLLARGSDAWTAWELLDAPRGMGWVTTSKLLARKRPKLLPVYDRVVRCAYGHPKGYWAWLHSLFVDRGGILTERLDSAHRAADVPLQVSALQVLDVIVWEE